MIDGKVCHFQEISDGKDGKLNGDNLDVYVDTNDVRMENKARDYHFFASNWVADRVDLQSTADDCPISSFDDVRPESFLPDQQEIEKFKVNFKPIKVILL